MTSRLAVERLLSPDYDPLPEPAPLPDAEGAGASATLIWNDTTAPATTSTVVVSVTPSPTTVITTLPVFCATPVALMPSDAAVRARIAESEVEYTGGF